MIESELRKGQVADSLEGLCLTLGEKSLCFRTEVRNADSQRTTHRAWDNVHKLDVEARKCRPTYLRGRRALTSLGVDAKNLATLHDNTDEDLKGAEDIKVNRRIGQKWEGLAWFWRI